MYITVAVLGVRAVVEKDVAMGQLEKAVEDIELTFPARILPQESPSIASSVRGTILTGHTHFKHHPWVEILLPSLYSD